MLVSWQCKHLLSGPHVRSVRDKSLASLRGAGTLNGISWGSLRAFLGGVGTGDTRRVSESLWASLLWRWALQGCSVSAGFSRGWAGILAGEEMGVLSHVQLVIPTCSLGWRMEGASSASSHRDQGL